MHDDNHVRRTNVMKTEGVMAAEFLTGTGRLATGRNPRLLPLK
jgi:hypothetical protein